LNRTLNLFFDHCLRGAAVALGLEHRLAGKAKDFKFAALMALKALCQHLIVIRVVSQMLQLAAGLHEAIAFAF
jgi:hypothetical protein